MASVFHRLKRYSGTLWRWFRRRSTFIQLLLVVPILCAVALTLLVGNMGLALMGTAVALNALWVGWCGGAFAVVLGKAAAIVVKDRRK